MHGNCSTSYPLELSVAAGELASSERFLFLQHRQLVLRAPEGAAITDLSIRDSSPWTAVASFDDSCQIVANVSLNEPDVDSTADAEAHIAAIEGELAEARSRRDRYEQLLLLTGAYDFLYELVGSLYDELSNDMMQDLRRAYRTAQPAIDALEQSTACASDIEDHHGTILDMAAYLFIIGDPESWQRSEDDPTTRTLEEAYSEFAGEGIIAQIERLAEQADPALEAQYQQGFDDAALEVAELEDKLRRARTQLSSWLD